MKKGGHERLYNPLRRFEVRTVAPTFLQNRPFGEHVEGLSHCQGETNGAQGTVRTYAIENHLSNGKVQTVPDIDQVLTEFDDAIGAGGADAIGEVIALIEAWYGS